MAVSEIIYSPKTVGALYTPKEVAEKVGCHVVQIYHYIENDELFAVNIGKGRTRPRWMVPEDSAEEFIEKYRRNIGTGEKKARSESRKVAKAKEDKEAAKAELMKKLYYVKEAMFDLSVRMEEIEEELSKL